MSIKDLISEVEYAAMRGVTVRTIQRERASLRLGPPYLKMGRKVFYRPEAIDAWLLAQEQTPPRSDVPMHTVPRR